MNRILEEMIEVLFLESTIEQVYEINKYVGNKDYIFSRFGIDFRIHKTESIYTTLEARLTDEFGNFYKPIGFYDFDIDDNITQIGFLKEFQISYENISHKIPAEIKIKARHFSLIDNVYAALASREVGNVIRKMFASPNYSPYNHLDSSKFQVSNLVVNNLPVQVKTSIMGAIEAVYNDENNDFDEDLTVIFQNNDGISIHCNEISYSTMQEKEMLSIFKAVQMNTNERIIINGLIDSCQKIDAKLFLPYLKNNSIKTNMPNKLKFYNFFEYMIGCMKDSSVGNINYKIESVEWSKKTFQSIKFIDEIHAFPRLTILYEQQNKNLYLQVLPF